MMQILKFSEFINESKKSIIDFNLDDRFPWCEDVADMIDSIEDKIGELKEQYEYERHKGSGGFEFDIKARNWPKAEELSKKYNISEDEIYSLWDTFISDNLQSGANDIIESSKYFTDWAQEGRSGGWLVLKHNSRLFDTPEDDINDTISDLNYYTKDIDDEEIEEWKNLGKKPGYRLLQRSGTVEESLDIKRAEEESEKVKGTLKEFIEDLDKLEGELIGVEKTISDFWKNSQESFESWIKNYAE